jgi:thioredoxin 1
MKSLTVEEFKDLVMDFSVSEKFKGKRPACIDYKANWCQPCKMLARTFESIEDQYPHVDFYSLDIDECYEVAQHFNIKSIPQVMYINDNGYNIEIGNKSTESIKEQLSKISK